MYMSYSMNLKINFLVKLEVVQFKISNIKFTVNPNMTKKFWSLKIHECRPKV